MEGKRTREREERETEREKGWEICLYLFFFVCSSCLIYLLPSLLSSTTNYSQRDLSVLLALLLYS